MFHHHVKYQIDGYSNLTSFIFIFETYYWTYFDITFIILWIDWIFF